MTLAAVQGLRWNCEPVSEHAFPRLRLQHRQHLVKLPSHVAWLPITDPKARATPLSPEQWQAMLPSQSGDAESAARQAEQGGWEASTQPRRRRRKGASRGPPRELVDSLLASTGDVRPAEGQTLQAAQPSGQPIMLDVRNGYEWDAGHFATSQRPLEVSLLTARPLLLFFCCERPVSGRSGLQDSFNETPLGAGPEGSIPAALRGVDPDTPVMMYCTGGIRCAHSSPCMQALSCRHAKSSHQPREAEATLALSLSA